jgi:hypothetical protein
MSNKHSAYIDFSSGKLKEEYIEISNVIQFQSLDYIKINSTFIEGNSLDMKELTNSFIVQGVNSRISEEINGLKIQADILLESPECVSDLLNFAWLVDHLVMVLLNIVTIKSVSENCFEFMIINDKIMQVRNLWFGQALEFMSLKAATASVTKLSMQLSINMEGKLDNDSVEHLYSRVLSLVPQHWRMPLEGPVLQLLDKIKQLFLILTTVYARCELDKIEKPFSKKDARKLNVLKSFELIKDFQKRQNSSDRLFDFKKGGLITGNVEMMRGTIQQMENIADRIIGPEWHNVYEKFQKNYLLEHLGSVNWLEVLDFELKPEHCLDGEQAPERLDIDFFVRDLRNKNIYAVQLKHVQSMTHSGLAHIINYLAIKDTKLNKGVLQLQNLHVIINKYPMASEYLKSQGILKEEISNLVPVLVHNVGVLDCLNLHNDILVYDLHTFRKALTGFTSTIEKYDNGIYEFNETQAKTASKGNLKHTDSVIDEYLMDGNFGEISHFDILKSVAREVTVGDKSFKALGIGI